MIKKKVCLLGAFGVGKTSLLRQFVDSIFGDIYHSTIGVKVDKTVVRVGAEEVLLLLWDVAGEEEFFQIPPSYVKGAHGCLLVADGTRPETLDTLEAIRRRVVAQLGADLPITILLNKCDLVEDWKIADETCLILEADGSRCLRTSAKTGAGVEEAFADIAAQMLA